MLSEEEGRSWPAFLLRCGGCGFEWAAVRLYYITSRRAVLYYVMLCYVGIAPVGRGCKAGVMGGGDGEVENKGGTECAGGRRAR